MAHDRVFLGGHSYGGRQASILAAAEPTLADGLLLLSYPLHPPRRPSVLRTAHFPELRTRTLFVHGSRDPFGSLEEVQSALALIPAPTGLVAIEGAGHQLSPPGGKPGTDSDLSARVVAALGQLLD
jgi:predicted alpha/beta-hydrolase family hydrolase